MSTRTSPASLPSRRGVLATAAWTLLLGGCYPFQDRTYQNFRIIVEDEFGRELGSGVWRYGETVPPKAYSEWYGADGEAFPIVHPTYGKMYVARGPNSGWGGGALVLRTVLLPIYVREGLLPETYAGRTGYGADGFKRLQAINKRVELPLKATPLVVRFAQDNNRESIAIVRTFSIEKKPVDVVLKFFAVPTKDAMSTGITSYLPWLIERAGMPIVGDYRPNYFDVMRDKERDREIRSIKTWEFLNTKDHTKAEIANTSKK